MSTKKEVVLDRAGLARLVVGVIVLVGLGFTTGAVIGFGLHPEIGDAAGTSARAAPQPVRQASAAQPCPAPDSGRAVGMASAAHSGRTSAVRDPGARVSDPGVVVSKRTGKELAQAPAQPRNEVARAPARPGSEMARATAPPGPSYAVQVGVFGVSRNADRLAARLRNRGYDPLITAMRNRSGHWLRRVALSLYSTQDEAQDAAASFRAREGLPAVVVVYREPER